MRSSLFKKVSVFIRGIGKEWVGGFERGWIRSERDVFISVFWRSRHTLKRRGTFIPTLRIRSQISRCEKASSESINDRRLEIALWNVLLLPFECSHLLPQPRIINVSGTAVQNDRARSQRPLPPAPIHTQSLLPMLHVRHMWELHGTESKVVIKRKDVFTLTYLC